MTCHNRRAATLRCLETLEKQKGISNIELTVYLVDDGSTDGTAEAVSGRYPQVNILEGDGSLYWGGGMRKAMHAAMKKDYDFYLWLNDDVELYNHAVKTLIITYNSLEKEGYFSPIIGGSCKNAKSQETTYGGWVNMSSWQPLRFKRIEPGKSMKKCDVLNGNLVLIPEEAVKKVGNINPKLTHSKGDYEYCLRAAKKDISSWIAPGYLGECSRNSMTGTWKDTSLPLIQRYKKLLGVKGQPLYPRYIYVSEFGGILWPLIFAGVYIRPLLDQIKKILSYLENKYEKVRAL